MWCRLICRQTPRWEASRSVSIRARCASPSTRNPPKSARRMVLQYLVGPLSRRHMRSEKSMIHCSALEFGEIGALKHSSTSQGKSSAMKILRSVSARDISDGVHRPACFASRGAAGDVLHQSSERSCAELVCHGCTKRQRKSVRRSSSALIPWTCATGMISQVGRATN